jgi:hypothetical protein
MEIVYLVVDAVDESRPRDKLLLLLEALVTDPRFCKIRLITTSRMYHDIESALIRLSSPISMSNEEVDKDIRTFVTSKLDKKLIGVRAAHKSSVSDALVHKAKGMYVSRTSSNAKLRTSRELGADPCNNILDQVAADSLGSVCRVIISSKINFRILSVARK